MSLAGGETTIGGRYFDFSALLAHFRAVLETFVDELSTKKIGGDVAKRNDGDIASRKIDF